MMKTKYHLSIFLIALFAGLMGFTTDAAWAQDTERPTANGYQYGYPKAISPTEIEVRWKPGKDNETAPENLRYRVWYKKASATTEQFDTGPYLTGKTKYTITGLDPDTEYLITVEVRDKANNHSIEPKVSVKTLKRSYAIEVGGVEVTSENAANITGPKITGQVSFDLATNTLTLNNATIDFEGGPAIYDTNRGGILTIKLQGRNTIIGLTAIDILYRPLRISGGGTLIIDAGSASIGGARGYGVSIENCTLTANRRMAIRGELQINNSNVYVIENAVGAYDVWGNFTLMGCQIVSPTGAQIKKVMGVSGRSTTVVDASGNVCTEVCISTGSQCHKMPESLAELTLSPEKLEADASQNYKKVTLSCNVSYHVIDLKKPDWTTVGGNSPGYEASQELTIAFLQNKTGKARTGEITFTVRTKNGKEHTVTLPVTQQGASSTPSANLTLEPKELTLEAKENGQYVTLSCDKAYHVNGYDKPDWLSASGSSSGNKDRQELWILAQENPGAERTGEITIKTTEGNVKLKVTQKAASSTPSGKLTLDPKALTMKYHRNEAEVTLACSDKEFSINQVVIDQLDWLSATGGSGLYKKHFIRITAQENPGAKRSGTVTFKTTEGEVTLNVTQEAKSTAPPTLTLTPTTLTFAASGGASQSVAVKSSVEGWGVRLKDRTQDWLTVTPDAAAKTVIVAVKPNTGTKKRSAEVEVVSDNGLTSSFFVTQQGNRPPEAVSGLSLNPEAMTMGGSSGAVGFTLKSDKPWTVTADADWLHPGSTRGNAGTTYFRLRFDQNTTGAVRTGKLTFTTTDSKATKTFTLTQRVGSAKPKPSKPSEGTYDYDLAVNPESITLSGEGGGSSIDVVTHRLWAGSTTDDWITLEKAVGSGDGSFDFTVAPNPSKEMRHGKITVRTEHGMDELTIAIHQQGQTGDIVLPGAVKVSSLTLDPATLVVDGDISTTLISALVSPENAANKSLLWMSSNPSVATVSVLGQKRSGVALLPQLRFAPDADDYALVTIAGKGKATITAATSDGSGIVARCEIEVRSTVGNVVPYAPAAKIYATPGTLHLTLPQATRVEIYTLLGIRLRTLDAPAGDTSVTLPRGLYIVRAGTAAQKVRIE